MLIDQAGILGFGINSLTHPPGADYCDIYLLDSENSQFFEAKQSYRYFPIGTRKNIKSGISEMTFGAGELYYLGLLNPDITYGIHTSIEVVAIVLEEDYAQRTVSVPQVKTHKIPYLKN